MENIKIKNKRIWNMWENALIFACIVVIIISWLSGCKKVAFVFLIVALIMLIEEIVRMRKYNNMISRGEVLVGKVCEYMIYRPWTYIKVVYIDPETEQRYTYSTISVIVETYEVSKILDKNPDMYIVVDKYMKKHGAILLQEYLAEKEEEIQIIRYDEVCRMKNMRGR